MESQVNLIPRFADLANLSNEKLQPLETILARILASPKAQDIYAQIIDGRATWQSYIDPNTKGFPKETTIVSDHPNPSEEASQLYEKIRRVFTPQALRVDIQVGLPLNKVGFDVGADSDIAGSTLSKCTTG